MTTELRQSLYTILNQLAISNPKLVLMQGRQYFRIEDLIRWARKDFLKGTSKDRALLSEPIYWTEYDVRGKLLLKGVTRNGDELVAFVEPGSDVQASQI
jgi:hypothetical protein